MGRSGESAEIYTEPEYVLIYDRTGSLIGERPMRKVNGKNSVAQTVKYYSALGYKVNREISHRATFKS
jgi:hypothetical protein